MMTMPAIKTMSSLNAFDGECVRKEAMRLRCVRVDRADRLSAVRDNNHRVR